MRIFDAPKTFIESLAALTGHEELESQAVSIISMPQSRPYLPFALTCQSY
jgi:hypothetical protein